ncbi:hypothetical protein BWI97_21105, partial [Siphonobacter sp. BAB-5405]|uniref:hypothetical protein n=1 Tax=Siphonobacter sp. BAB-5405 TaxID=1864825 RepID=UPI000CC71BEF
MKKIYLFLTTLVFIISCRPNDSEIQKPANSKFFDSENYRLLKTKPDSIQIPASSLPLIKAVRDDIKGFDNDLHFSDRFLIEHGLPLWKLSIPIPGVKENKVLVPIVKEGSDFVGKILYAIQGENKQWRYNLLDIKTFLREIISSDATKEKYLEQLVNFSFLILNQKVSGVTVPCSMGTNITQLNEVTIKQLKSAKTTECVTVSGWDGYCMWGGTVDNPYQYFNGCQGTYISTQVCYDNPDAFWAHYTGQALG